MQPLTPETFHLADNLLTAQGFFLAVHLVLTRWLQQKSIPGLRIALVSYTHHTHAEQRGSSAACQVRIDARRAATLLYYIRPSRRSPQTGPSQQFSMRYV